jgi:hypothetical protein
MRASGAACELTDRSFLYPSALRITRIATTSAATPADSATTAANSRNLIARTGVGSPLGDWLGGGFMVLTTPR